MESLRTVLMMRDGLTRCEANAEIQDMRDRIREGEDPEEILYEIGLEPDFVLDLLGED